MSGRVIIFVLGLLAVGFGFLLFVFSKSAPQESVALGVSLIGWLQVIGAVVVDRLDRIREAVAGLTEAVNRARDG